MSEKCAVHGCIRPSRSRGWCAKHYERWAKGGSVQLQGGGKSRTISLTKLGWAVTSLTPETFELLVSRYDQIPIKDLNDEGAVL